MFLTKLTAFERVFDRTVSVFLVFLGVMLAGTVAVAGV